MKGTRLCAFTKLYDAMKFCVYVTYPKVFQCHIKGKNILPNDIKHQSIDNYLVYNSKILWDNWSNQTLSQYNNGVSCDEIMLTKQCFERNPWVTSKK